MSRWPWLFFKQGYHAKSLVKYFKYFMLKRLQEFATGSKKDVDETTWIESERVKKLQQITKGLHTLLSHQSSFSYSILIAIDQPINSLILKTIESALNQTAPNFEVIIGVKNNNESDELLIKGHFKNQDSSKLKIVTVLEGSESSQINELAEKATGAYLFPLKACDWLRPDFIYRCEQLLRLHKNFTDPICIYSDEFNINEQGYPIPGKKWIKPETLMFPYHFRDDIGHTLLIPKEQWTKAGGLSLNLLDQGLWELALRLEEIGCQFLSIPFCLYAHRSGTICQSGNTETLIKSFKDYTARKGLEWKIVKGLLPQTVRAVPELKKNLLIQVIIPYKNQKELTLKSIKSALNQTGVSVFITAVDNNSDDVTIAQEIRELGGEVITINEPFNFSRLNNLAVEKTTLAKECEYLLFLNNDVELEENALLEMARWIEQSNIGMVGCYLTYPNGLLQHGGVDILSYGPAYNVTWSHSEKFRSFENMDLSKTLRIADGVTAACSLIKKSDFIQVGGFDEGWYPIAYSDTNLAVKLAAIGLKCFYTPYAKGVHYESISRMIDNIEDIETSRWLHDKFIKHQLGR
ncbi:MAG: glycosyltransferase [Parachlamydiaceae bacterium]|nr:glycosyltransferase [Parachlamydiaceae bacterium]